MLAVHVQGYVMVQVGHHVLLVSIIVQHLAEIHAMEIAQKQIQHQQQHAVAAVRAPADAIRVETVVVLAVEVVLGVLAAVAVDVRELVVVVVVVAVAKDVIKHAAETVQLHVEKRVKLLVVIIAKMNVPQFVKAIVLVVALLDAMILAKAKQLLQVLQAILIQQSKDVVIIVLRDAIHIAQDVPGIVQD